MTKRDDINAKTAALSNRDGQNKTIPPSVLVGETLQPIVDSVVMQDELHVDTNNGEFDFAPYDNHEGRRALALYQTENAVREFVGELTGKYASKAVTFETFGGVRFHDAPDGYEYFMVHQELIGGGLGATFGSLDSGNYFATSKTGGLTAYVETAQQVLRVIGNHSSTNHIDGTTLSFDVTSSQVFPYGERGFSFNGKTDVDFTDVRFNAQVKNQAGTVVYNSLISDAQWQATNTSDFAITSVAGDFTIPFPIPLPMTSNEVFKVEYQFSEAIRVRGDGVIPAFTQVGKQLEFYPINYEGNVFFHTADFTAQTNKEYKVDTTAGGVAVSVHPTVKSFWIGDEDETWSNTNPVTIDGSLVLGTAQRGKRFHIILKNGSYVAYAHDGAKVV